MTIITTVRRKDLLKGVKERKVQGIYISKRKEEEGGVGHHDKHKTRSLSPS